MDNGFPVKEELKLQRTFNFYTDKIYQEMKKAQGKTKVSKSLQKSMFSIAEVNKKDYILQLAEDAKAINKFVFESWRTLTDDELNRQDLTGAKKWIKINVETYIGFTELLGEQLKKERLERIDSLRKDFNSTFNTRLGKLESGEISKTNLSKMATELKAVPNPNKEIKALIDNLKNYDKFTKEDINLLGEWMNRRNELWARNETGNLYSSQLLDLWANNEIEEFVWQTERDGRVRPTHAELQGKTIKISEADFLPGEEYGCRCWAEPTK